MHRTIIIPPTDLSTLISHAILNTSAIQIRMSLQLLSRSLIVTLMLLTTAKTFPCKSFFGAVCVFVCVCGVGGVGCLFWLSTAIGSWTHSASCAPWGCRHMKHPAGHLIAKGNIWLLYISEVRLRDGHTNCFQDAFASSIFQVQPCLSIVQKIMRTDDRSLALPTLASWQLKRPHYAGPVNYQFCPSTSDRVKT